MNAGQELQLRRITVLIAAVAATLVTAPTPPVGAAASITIPTATAWGFAAFSAPTAERDTLQGDMGRNFAAASIYMRLDLGNNPTLTTYPKALEARQNGFVYLNINSEDAQGPICWDSVTAGNYDQKILEYAAEIRKFVAGTYVTPVAPAFPAPGLVVTFQHEPSVGSPGSTAMPRCAADTKDPDNPTAAADRYKAAFRHFVGVMKPNVPAGVRFAYVPNGANFENGPGSSTWADYYDPGANYYQVIGVDAYNTPQGVDPDNAAPKTAEVALGKFYDWLKMPSHQAVSAYPRLIGELGNDMDPDAALGPSYQAAQWVTDAVNIIKSNENTPTGAHTLMVNWNLRTDPDHYYSPTLNTDARVNWLGHANDAFFHGGKLKIVQSPVAKTGNSTKATASFPATPTAGNLLIAIIAVQNPGDVATAPTGWTKAIAAPEQAFIIYYRTATSNTPVPTWTLTTQAYWIAKLLEVSGVTTLHKAVSRPTDQATTTTITSGTAQPITANRQLCMAVLWARTSNTGAWAKSPTRQFVVNGVPAPPAGSTMSIEVLIKFAGYPQPEYTQDTLATLVKNVGAMAVFA